MNAVAVIFGVAAILASGTSSPTKRDTEIATNEQEFEASHVGLIISPILSTSEIREIEVYWSHSCFRSGDTIALYTEEPSTNSTPIYSFQPTASSGIRQTGIDAEFVPSSSLTFERQCLGYHVAWLRDDSIMKTNCLETRPNWMADRKEALGSKRFRDLFLPGTHNSGSYSIVEEPTSENIVSKYIICQDEDILAQLIYGVRYLDIRAGYYSSSDPVWWVNHGLFKVVEMQEVIDDVKTFLDNTEEIVIFDVQEFPVGFGTDLTIHAKLVAYLEEQFADYLLPKSYGWSTSLETVWASGKRLIIGYDESSVVPLYDSIWPCVTQQWGDVRTISDLYTYLSGIESAALSSSAVNPRSAMAELTPNTWDILLDRLGGLRQMADDVNVNVTKWFRHLVCGYVGSHPKVCCDVLTSQPTPTSTALGFWGDGLPFNKNTGCGKSLIRSNMETLGTFPFVARIGFINVDNGRTKYPCSGVIVNERTVLTTGTCALATSNSYKLQTVLLGEFDEADNPDCNSLFCGLPTQEYNISYVVKHPDFRSETFENNIALIRLQTPIDFTVTAQSICLLESENYNLVGKMPVLVGWGKISSQKEKPTQQQWLETKILPKQDCSTFMNRGFSVDLCAGSAKEPCSGFSGSPLVLKYGDTYTLVGILSYGSDCEINSNSPSAYVSVAKYADWILTNS
ncbi:uncharacterized protein [Neodiprion pinetum]|uniref:uncharacterized protein isoform X1 n=1 Tax=Neodiprion pinetum TaxID=441929 RepID=UPI001EDE0E09|nr:uncharacterized protein LOC124221157 isoform X1 [Neodiprion pinetum]